MVRVYPVCTGEVLFDKCRSFYRTMETAELGGMTLVSCRTSFDRQATFDVLVRQMLAQVARGLQKGKQLRFALCSISLHLFVLQEFYELSCVLDPILITSCSHRDRSSPFCFALHFSERLSFFDIFALIFFLFMARKADQKLDAILFIIHSQWHHCQPFLS